MKKFLIILGLILSVSPALAVCSITGGACTTSAVRSNWESSPLQERVVPNNLQEMQRSNAFQPSYIKPYYNELINTKGNTRVMPQSDYNSNCQFGVCLPGESTGAGADIVE